ncbi:hypothetical protein [Streptomyces sp. NPDC004008]
MWSPTSSALISVENDVVLVDALITYDQVDALAHRARASASVSSQF